MNGFLDEWIGGVATTERRAPARLEQLADATRRAGARRSGARMPNFLAAEIFAAPDESKNPPIQKSIHPLIQI